MKKMYYVRYAIIVLLCAMPYVSSQMFVPHVVARTDASRTVRTALLESALSFTLDTDGDGIPNVQDDDDDGDGVLDNADAEPLNAAVTEKTTLQQTVTVQADAPLMSNTANKADTNFGSATTAETRNNQRTMLLKFQVPSAIDVQSATLWLYTNTENDPLDVYAMADTSWDENTVTANTAPLQSTTYIGQTGAPSAGKYQFALAGNDLPQSGSTYSYYVLDSDDPSGSIETVYMRETAQKAAYMTLAYTTIADAKVVVTAPESFSTYAAGNQPIDVQMRLASAPSSTVYVPLASSDPSVATISGDQVLVFTPSNWNQPQTVSFMPQSGGTFVMQIRPLHSTDATFNGFNQDDVSGFSVRTMDITNLTPISSDTGSVFTRQLQVVSSNGATAFDYQVLEAPVGMMIVPGSGNVLFRPTADQVGTHTLKFRVTNNLAEVSEFSIPVTVTQGSTADLSGAYVVPGGGSDSVSAGSAANPYNSLGYAISRLASSGGTVYVRGGDYSLTSTEDITTNASSVVVVKPLDGEYVRLNFANAVGINITSTARNIEFAGFDINGMSDMTDHWTILSQGFWDNSRVSRGGGIALLVNGQDIVIRDNVIHDAYQKAINIQDGRYITMEGNIIYNIATKSLSGGHGIMRQQGYSSFADADDANKYRWDIRGNLLFNVEQRIYSWVQSKGYLNMTLDEGKPILIDEPATSGQQMKARIADNIVAFASIDSMVLKSTPNLEVSNNSIFSLGEHADGITDRNEIGLFTGFVFKNNAVETAPGTTAIDIADAMADGDYTVSGNVYAGGSAATVTGITKYTASPLFADPLNGDFSLRSGVPSGVGADASRIAALMQRTQDFGVRLAVVPWQTDHLKNVQTMFDNIPGVNDGIVGNETVFTNRGTYDNSVKEPGRKAWFFTVVNGAWKTATGSASTQEIIVPLEYSDWYDGIRSAYKQANGSNYSLVRWGDSVIAQPQVFGNTDLYVASVSNQTTHTQTEAIGQTISLDGDILIDFTSFVPTAGQSFDLMIATTITTTNLASAPFDRVIFAGVTPQNYRLEIVADDASATDVLRLTIDSVAGEATATPTVTVFISPTPTVDTVATQTVVAGKTGTAITGATQTREVAQTATRVHQETAQAGVDQTRVAQTATTGTGRTQTVTAQTAIVATSQALGATATAARVQTATAAIIAKSVTAEALATAKAALAQTQTALAQTAVAGKQQTANALATAKAGAVQTKAAIAQTAAAGKAQTATAGAISKAETAAPQLTAKAGAAQTKAAIAQTAAAGKAQTATAGAISKAETAAPQLTAKAGAAQTKAAIAQTAAAGKAQTATAGAISKAETAAPQLTAKAGAAQTKAAIAQTAAAAKAQTATAKAQTKVALATNVASAKQTVVSAKKTTLAVQQTQRVLTSTARARSSTDEVKDSQITATIQARWLQATRTMRRGEMEMPLPQIPAYVQWLSNR